MPELARFGAALLDGAESRIGAAERALLFTPLTEASDTARRWGSAGGSIHDGQGRRRWHHAGSTPGGRAALVVYPERRLSIALASNTMMAPGDVLTPASELADVFS